jgi:hypothetical protein
MESQTNAAFFLLEELTTNVSVEDLTNFFNSGN